MNKEDEVIIKRELKHDFYFIDFPADINKTYWKDPSGEYTPIVNMELKHISNCIKQIKSSINRLKDRPKPTYVKEYLISLAEEKLEELEKYRREFDT